MTQLLAALTSRFAGPAFALLALAFGVTLFVTHLENAALRRDRDALHAEIYDENTGWQARLTVCRASRDAAEEANRRQSAEVQRLSDAAVAAQRLADDRLVDLRRQSANATARGADFLSNRSQAPDVCDRVSDVDRRILEALR